jgi:DNA-binding NarL/FixJ family response regulator
VSEVLSLCPDVIAVDIIMPILSGIDAAHQLRESASSAKIVFLTGVTTPKVQNHTFRVVAKTYRL